MKLQKLLIFFLMLAAPSPLTAQSSLDLLWAVRTQSPRQTMKSFMDAMNDYRRGVEQNEESLRIRIKDAVSTLDLSAFPPLMRDTKGAEAAILLKEVIDRIAVIDYETIPDESSPIEKWNFKNTQIALVRITTADRKDEYLFSSHTVLNASAFYSLVQNRPYVKGSGQGAFYEPPFIERHIPGWSNVLTFGLYRWQWLGLLIAFLIGLIGKFVTEQFMDRIKAIVKKTKGQWDDHLLATVEPPVGLICASLIWFIALRVLRIEGEFLNILSLVVQVVFSFSCVWLAYRIADAATDLVRHFSKNKTFLLHSHLEPLFLSTLKVFIVVFGILVSLQNLGINVMSLLAGLGIGGLAFALAAKDTAANVFGSIMILWDKPFNIGDWIVAGEIEGTVEEIGFRSTRVRTFYKSQVTLPNSQLANVNIDNMGRRPQRRIKTFFGLTYDTPVEKIESFVEGLKNIIRSNRYTDKENFQVCFNEYGDSSLNVMLYCFLTVPDWSTELVERQNLLIEIKRMAEAIKVNFAFPTRSLHIETTPDKSLPKDETFAGQKSENLKSVAKEFGPEGKMARPDGLGYYTPPYEEKPVGS